MEDQTVERYQLITATCAAGIIGTTFKRIYDCLHASAAGKLRATTAVAPSPIQKNHSAEIVRRISSTYGELAET